MSSMMQLTCLPRWFGLFFVVVHKVANSDLGLGTVELELELELVAELVVAEDFGTVEAEIWLVAWLTMVLTFPPIKIRVVSPSRIITVSVRIVNKWLPLKTYSIYLILILVENFFECWKSRTIISHMFIRFTNCANGKNFRFLNGF